FYMVQDAASGKEVGYISSAFFSPNLDANIALAMMPISHTAAGAKVKAVLPGDGPVDAEIVPIPFVDPKKEIPAQKLSD
ncbi:MAG: glycine cleavage T C-terminal barrel domain-containing protein, partial [Dehalococcoidia bacterium]